MKKKLLVAFIISTLFTANALSYAMYGNLENYQVDYKNDKTIDEVESPNYNGIDVMPQKIQPNDNDITKLGENNFHTLLYVYKTGTSTWKNHEFDIPHDFRGGADNEVPKDKLRESDLTAYEKKVMKEEKELLYKYLNSTIKNKSSFKTIKFVPRTDYDLYPELNHAVCSFIIDHLFAGDTLPMGAYVIRDKVYFVSRSDNKVYEYKLERKIMREIEWEISE